MIKTFAFLAVASVAGVAQAQSYNDTWPHWYVGVHGGIAYVEDASVDVSNAGSTTSGDVKFDNGYSLGGSIGYRPYTGNSFLDRTRWEIEYTARVQDFDSFNSPAGNSPLQGDLLGNAIMANLYYDIDTGSRWTPYLGAGAGLVRWDFESSTLGIDDTSTEFAYQGMAGLYYSPELMPDTEWGLGYRYFASSDPRFQTNAGARVDHDFASHNVELQARFRF